MDKKAVIKIGGSLAEQAPALLQHILDHAQSFPSQAIFIPGGGIFADFIRTKEKELGLKNDSSHWMAVLSMEQYGHYLAEKTNVPLVTDLKNNNHKASLFLPYTFLRKNDPLPHSWDVTSDTIAAMFAIREEAEFIKATDVDGVLVDGKTVPQIETPKLACMEITCVDRYLPSYLGKHKLDCFIINGKYPERVLEHLQGKRTIGTLIKGNI